MERYIDSEQVVREILSLSLTDGIYGRGLKRGIDLSLSIINRQDTADVVEVVRCRKCYNSERIDNVLYCNHFNKNVDEDDFCSQGC